MGRTSILAYAMPLSPPFPFTAEPAYHGANFVKEGPRNGQADRICRGRRRRGLCRRVSRASRPRRHLYRSLARAYRDDPPGRAAALWVDAAGTPDGDDVEDHASYRAPRYGQAAAD